MKAVYGAYDRQQHRHTDEYRFCPRCATPLAEREIGGQARPACSTCGFVRFRNPAPAVVVLVVDGGRVLLGRRSGEPGAGRWALPSGYIEYTDDYLTTAVREVKEETGLDVVLEAIVHVESAFMSPQFHFFAAYLLARPTGGTLFAGDDLAAVAWFEAAGPLPEMAFQPDRDLIGEYAAGTMRRLPLENMR